jgi:PTS system ascorbate-specific IIA component
MNNGILIIAHAPLASALRACVLHVFPDTQAGIMAFDVQPNVAPEETLVGITQALAALKTPQTLILTDVCGATPCNAAQKLANGVTTKLLAGVNLPMLLRTVTYRHEPLDALMARALAGGAQGVVQVAGAASTQPDETKP